MTPTLRPGRRLPLAAAVLAAVLAASGCGAATAPAGAAPTGAVATASTAAVSAPPTVADPPPSTAPATVGGPPPSTAPAPRTSTLPAPAPRTTTPPAPTVHFATPQAAMRYLAAAYNRDDRPALKKVTNSAARNALVAMHQEATNLVLTGCTRRASGDYLCQFRHDYPARLHRSGHGRAMFLAAPAGRPGWYMTVLLGCG